MSLPKMMSLAETVALIEVQSLDIQSQDSTLSVAVKYRNRRTGQQQLAQFSRSV